MPGGLFDQRWSHVKRMVRIFEAREQVREEERLKMESKNRVKDMRGS